LGRPPVSEGKREEKKHAAAEQTKRGSVRKGGEKESAKKRSVGVCAKRERS